MRKSLDRSSLIWEHNFTTTGEDQKRRGEARRGWNWKEEAPKSTEHGKLQASGSGKARDGRERGECEDMFRWANVTGME